jgi:hypothetical protein
MMNNLKDLEIQALILQKEVCIKYGADFLMSPFDSIIGVALDTFSDSKITINGLRHSIEKENVSNWYIWSGEYSSTDDFFKPIHVKHLLEICPKAIDYLGLAPGWRFLFDSMYEDVWYDENLLL